MLAACGLYVPMISGRGLGHTGGTLDKLNSIPGYQTQPGLGLFRQVVKDVGCAVIGQTADLAPADKRLYGIRDVTATVESVPLITASILSKKLASGLEHLVMDTKVGSGAFMATLAESRELASSIVAVANGAGVKTSALITDMNEPLAPFAGNGLEVQHACEYLAGTRQEPRVHEVTVALGAELLVSAGLAANTNKARSNLDATLSSGAAADRFDRMVNALGGPSDFVRDHRKHLKTAPVVKPVFAAGEGFVSSIRTRDLGLAVIELGGGRRVAADKIDHRVGLAELAGKGAAVNAKTPLCVVHAADEAGFSRAASIVHAAYAIGGKPAATPVVIQRIGA
jgi:thymidine phosphorylase